jgi:uncharacterized protein
MVLTIGNIPEGRSVLSQKVDVEEDRAEWIPLIGDLQCRAEIDRLQDRISVHLYYQGKIELECSRCLEKIEHPVMGDCYVFIKHGSIDKNKSDEDEEGDFYFDDATEEIDVRSALFDDLLLSLPLKPLCSETCPGISPAGNNAVLRLEKEHGDPRWAGLKKINLRDSSTKTNHE